MCIRDRCEKDSTIMCSPVDKVTYRIRKLRAQTYVAYDFVQLYNAFFNDGFAKFSMFVRKRLIGSLHTAHPAGVPVDLLVLSVFSCAYQISRW